MHLAKLTIKNFKSFKLLNITLEHDVNVFTGVNNSGKTTVLESIALWQECYSKLLRKAGKSSTNYKKGDFILGTTQEKYFGFEEINSVRSPYYDDIFFDKDKSQPIELIAVFMHDGEELEIGFTIKSSQQLYVIELIGYKNYDFEKFNAFFPEGPDSLEIYYASPVAAIEQAEKYVTAPQIKDSILKRKSIAVLRNRIAALSATTLFSDFLNDLDYILANGIKNLDLFVRSNINNEVDVLVRYSKKGEASEKDISLLGSGTLQIIEILLSLYAPQNNLSLAFILLDEPDSHIHRSIQLRLLETLNKFSAKTQIFISTHNESLIRSVKPEQLFHLYEGNTTLQSIATMGYNKQARKFTGIMTGEINNISIALNGSGLDILNALESDKLIFVEGTNDARALSILYRQKIDRKSKLCFWVLGSVSKVFDSLPKYKEVFSAIKNNNSLWEKAELVFDRDIMLEQDIKFVTEYFTDGLKLPCHTYSSYTFESVLFTGKIRLAALLSRYIKLQKPEASVIEDDLITQLVETEKSVMDEKITVLLSGEPKNYSDQYLGRYTHKFEKLDKGQNVFENFVKDTHVSLALDRQTRLIASDREYYKLMGKTEVANILNIVLAKYGVDYQPENFIELITLIDKSTWYTDWDFVLKW